MASRMEVNCKPKTILSWFDYFVIFLIFMNSLFLAMYDYGDCNNQTDINKFIEGSGNLFTVLFTFECLAKILAMGFLVHRNAYLRDGWNWIDFFVVVVGYNFL